MSEPRKKDKTTSLQAAVALVEDGVAILGVIQVPANRRLYLAARGVGARFVDGKTEAALAPGAVDRPTRAVVSRSHLNRPTEEFLTRMMRGEPISSIQVGVKDDQFEYTFD